MLKWSAFPLKHATGNTMSEFIAENRGADAITRPNWSAVFSVAFCVACLIIVEFLPVSLLTPMAQDLGISEGVAGQSVTVTAFVAMFASLFITQTIQATDRRYVVILFAVLLTLSCLLVSFANSFSLLLIGRACLGLALGGYAVLLLLCLAGFSGSLALLCVPGVVVFACNGMLSVLTTLFLSNSVDYGQLKTGRREESVIFSMQTFVVKAASGVAVFLTGIGLDLIGLAGNAEETGPVAAQSAGTLLGLRLMMTVLPMAVLAAALVLFRRRFTLTDDRAAEISAALHREETQNG